MLNFQSCQLNSNCHIMLGNLKTDFPGNLEKQAVYKLFRVRAERIQSLKTKTYSQRQFSILVIQYNKSMTDCYTLSLSHESCREIQAMHCRENLTPGGLSQWTR